MFRKRALHDSVIRERVVELSEFHPRRRASVRRLDVRGINRQRRARVLLRADEIRQFQSRGGAIRANRERERIVRRRAGMRQALAVRRVRRFHVAAFESVVAGRFQRTSRRRESNRRDGLLSRSRDGLLFRSRDGLLLLLVGIVLLDDDSPSTVVRRFRGRGRRRRRRLGFAFAFGFVRGLVRGLVRVHALDLVRVHALDLVRVHALDLVFVLDLLERHGSRPRGRDGRESNLDAILVALGGDGFRGVAARETLSRVVILQSGVRAP